MKSYRDLDIYTESKRLAVIIHKISSGFPKFELSEEVCQIRRSSKPLTSMIVEDFIRFLIYAHAECDGTMIHLDFLTETNSLNNSDTAIRLGNDYDVLSKRISKFTR
jgi:four helix bundle protein